MKPWYRMQASASDASVVDIHIIDFIGGFADDIMNRLYNETIGVTARAFVEDLSRLPANVKTIRVHINSPGGDIQGGINIANALREQQTSKGRTVETVVDGLAASIASVIAMAGSRVVMADNALMMVHNPWMLTIGNAAQLRQDADALDTMRSQVIATYQWHSPKSAEELIALLDGPAGEGTWLSADEAIALGLATEKTEGLRAAASIDRRVLGKLGVPDQYKDRVNAWLQPEPPAPPKAVATLEVMRLCREAGVADLAEELVSANATTETVTARIASEKTKRADAKTRANAITAVCASARMPELAAEYIASGMSLEAVKRQLTTITAKVDNTEIDGTLPADQGGKSKVVNLGEVYAKLNSPKTKE